MAITDGALLRDFVDVLDLPDSIEWSERSRVCAGDVPRTSFDRKLGAMTGFLLNSAHVWRPA